MTEITQPGAIALKNSVKEAVESVDTPNSDGNVRSIIVGNLRDSEIVRRTGVLTKALGVRDDIAKKLKAIKATNCTSVDQETGKETFSFVKKEIEERKQLTSKLAKLDGAINDTLNDPTPQNYSTLAQVTEKSGK